MVNKEAGGISRISGERQEEENECRHTVEARRHRTKVGVVRWKRRNAI